MLGKTKDQTSQDIPSKTFVGVRFVLLGFDPADVKKVRSKLVHGGGVDVGQYGPSCTHLIVDKLIYDDPICVAARTDGKILVTGLWVDHSVDTGMPVDPTSVMYRPLKDLNGIPGAKSLVVCLTGYQRQDREDIMTMVALMGANFSKPLVASKVTHLICYKFEGEKYELAKKIRKIKLVNHRWLEDCLQAWKLLPDTNYAKSGYELEMMEIEAKDSEEQEAQAIAKNQLDISPRVLHTPVIRARPSPQQDASRSLLGAQGSNNLSSFLNNSKRIVSADETLSVQTSNLPDSHKKHSEVVGSSDNRTLGNATCGRSSDQPLKTYKRIVNSPLKTNERMPNSTKEDSSLKTNERTSNPTKDGKGLASTFGSAMRSDQSDAAKLSTISYTRKTVRKDSLPMLTAETLSNLSRLCKIDVDESKNKGFDMSLFMVEQPKDGTDSDGFRTPKKAELHHEGGKSGTVTEKRKIAVSYESSKSQKRSHDSKMSGRMGSSEPQVLLNAVTSKNMPDTNLETPQSSSIELKKMSLPSETGTEDVSGAVSAHSNGGKPPEELLDVVVPSAKSKRLEIEMSDGSSLKLSSGENGNILPKPLRRKVIAKKSMGSRQKIGPGNTKNQKCNICPDKAALQSDVVNGSIGRKETEDGKMIFVNANIDIVPPSISGDKANLMEMDVDSVVKSMVGAENKAGRSTNEETEAPGKKEHEYEFDARKDGDRPELIDESCKADIGINRESDSMQLITTKRDAKSLRTIDASKVSDEGDNGYEFKKAVCGRRKEPDQSICKDDVGEEEVTADKEGPSCKTLNKPDTCATGIQKSKKGGNRQESKSENNNEKIDHRKGKSIRNTTNKNKKSKTENLTEVKENRPVEIEDQSVNHGKKLVRKAVLKAGVTDPDSAQVERIQEFKIEPICFILSGHKVQRKEFQKIIKRLKGRVSRDSHEWSYQATHFVLPGPIRRTEKFFAAAASGRWILKADYLTASDQAGRFLGEEPYEWHGNSLSEDGTISLEAPRRWRLLRERTGHGAFYGMQIIVYGECIAPSLDTLKRVVKAGGGTILATSPPYTRFLKSGVDFAIVSPGMPRVDMWVQEFFRHEIPCILADYLVEYVCKPRYSLEKHVQYNTHAWAKRSFSNLQRRSEEID
ncbi:hypothetical protein NMG60_11035089 [Bertholletia excelsa]